MKKLKIIYEDKYLIIVNKPSGLFTISRDNQYDTNLYDEVKTYVKKQNPHNKIFIVHRLDKDTSGLVMFAKDQKVKYTLQNSWNNVVRKYYAIVLGKLKKKEDSLKNYLYETKDMKVIVTNNKTLGKLAITDYKVISSNNKYSLLDIYIKTGKKHQIRVQLRNIGNPILGDKIYNKKSQNKMYLMAYYLEFIHPITKRLCIIDIPIDKDFLTIIKPL